MSAAADAQTASGDGGSVSAARRLAQEARQFTSQQKPSMTDITEQFRLASEALKPGQLIKDEYFTLFESVGALEIMDPKMDTGLQSAEDLSAPSIYPADELSPQELIWVLDELICLEVAWLEEYPLSQTIFTSIHIDRILDPDNRKPYPFELRSSTASATLTNQVLHPYCLALLRCNGMVLELARSQGFYEEEDFISHTFGRDLIPDVADSEALALLTDASKWLEANVPAAELRAAIEGRLEFRRLFMKSIFGQINGWQDMSHLLNEDIEKTRVLASSKPECFSTKVLRHLATSTPPRPDLTISWADAKQKWHKVCSDVAEAPQSTSFWIRQSPTCLQRALWAFAARRPGTFARSIIQDIIFVDGKIADDVSHFDLLLTDIRDLVLPGHHLVDPDSFQIEAVSDSRHKCSRLMETFLDGMLDEYLNLFRLICQNRARIRRHSTQIIPIIDTLEQDLAQKHDAQLQALTLPERHDTVLGAQQDLRPLQTWTSFYKLKVMADTVLLGFETDIYMPDEICHMYWYLSTLLHDRRQLVEHIEVFTTHRAAALKEARDSKHLAECLVALHWYTSLTAELDVQIYLARALQTLYALLLSVKLIVPPPRSFAEGELLHDVRMKVYKGVTMPVCPTAQDFERARALSTSKPQAFEQIESNVQQAKAELAALKRMPPDVAKYIGTETWWKSEIKQLETTAVAILVAVTQLKRTHSAGIDESRWEQTLEVGIPAPGRRYHDWWVVPQIKAKR